MRINLNFISVIDGLNITAILKSFSLISFANIIKLIISFVCIKLMAIMLGPSGVALIGQLNNFVAMIMSFSGGGIMTGITKYVAENRDSEEKSKDYISTAFRITIYFSLTIGILLVLLHDFISRKVLLSPDYGSVFILFGSTLFLYALNTMILCLLNGYQELRKYVMVNLSGSSIGLFLTLLLIFPFGLIGAMISIVTTQSITFFVSCWMIRNYPWMSWSYFSGKFNKKIGLKYMRYSLMILMSTVFNSPVLIIIRGSIISNISMVDAGYWEGINRISGAYLSVIVAFFSTYYLPNISRINDRVMIKNEIFNLYKIIIPIIVLLFIIIYLFRYVIIKILFTEDFCQMENLFLWQLLGDFIKIMTWPMFYLMLSKSMLKEFVFCESLFPVLYLFLSLYFISIYNNELWAVKSYLITNLLYMLFCIFIFRKIILLK